MFLNVIGITSPNNIYKSTTYVILFLSHGEIAKKKELDKITKLRWMSSHLVEILYLIHMWLRHSNECHKFGYLEILKINARSPIYH